MVGMTVSRGVHKSVLFRCQRGNDVSRTEGRGDTMPSLENEPQTEREALRRSAKQMTDRLPKGWTATVIEQSDGPGGRRRHQGDLGRSDRPK